MFPETVEDQVDAYAIGSLHLNRYISIPRALRTLSAIDDALSELSFLDATLLEWRAVEQQTRRDSPDLATYVVEVSARRVIEVSLAPDFSAAFAIQGTNSEPLIISAHPRGSWAIDLIGKLSPLRALHDLLVLARDWGTTTDYNHLKNSQLAQEVRTAAIANGASELDMIRHTAELMSSAALPQEQIDAFVRGHAWRIASAAALISSEMDAVTVTGDLRKHPTGRLQAGAGPGLRIVAQRPGVWDERNRILPSGRANPVVTSPEVPNGSVPESE